MFLLKEEILQAGSKMLINFTVLKKYKTNLLEFLCSKKMTTKIQGKLQTEK